MAKASSNTEVAKPTEGGGFQLANAAAVEAFIAGKTVDGTSLVVDNSDPTEAQLSIISQVLAAETAEDVLAESNALSVRDDLIGENGRSTRWQLMNVRFLESKFKNEGGLPLTMYAAIQAADVDNTGAVQVLVTSAYKIMAQLLRLTQLGKLDGQTVVFAEKTTSRGFTVLNMISG